MGQLCSAQTVRDTVVVRPVGERATHLEVLVDDRGRTPHGTLEDDIDEVGRRGHWGNVLDHASGRHVDINEVGGLGG